MFQNPYAALMPQIQNQNQQFQQMFPQMNNQQNLIRVNGIDGAKAYQMPPNSTVALFDGNDDIMYIKTTDGAGFGNIRMFQFNEIQGNTNQVSQITDYVSRQEFEEFKKELMNNGKQSISRSKSNLTDKSTDN